MQAAENPLRVMHIISGDLWAGAEVQAFTLLKHLHHNVKLLVVLLNNGELAKRLADQGISVTVIPEDEYSSLKILISLTKLIRQFKPDILHTHRQKENILGSFANLICAFPQIQSKAKSIRTVHGAPESAPKGLQKIQVALDQFVGNYLQQAVISVSDELTEKLKKIFSSDRIYTIHNGVDISDLNIQAKNDVFSEPENSNTINIGIIGRLEPVKRIDIFIEMAVQLLLLGEMDFRFHIIGEGKLRAALEEKVSNIGLSEKISFHGHRSDAASFIRSLNLIVMCSDHEGTPMTALEALAMGTPMIAHNVGGLKKILEPYPSLLVNDHSPKGYADRVKDVISAAPMKIQLHERYSASLNKAQVLSLYRKLADH